MLPRILNQYSVKTKKSFFGCSHSETGNHPCSPVEIKASLFQYEVDINVIKSVLVVESSVIVTEHHKLHLVATVYQHDLCYSQMCTLNHLNKDFF